MELILKVSFSVFVVGMLGFFAEYVIGFCWLGRGFGRVSAVCVGLIGMSVVTMAAVMLVALWGVS